MLQRQKRQCHCVNTQKAPHSLSLEREGAREAWNPSICGLTECMYEAQILVDSFKWANTQFFNWSLLLRMPCGFSHTHAHSLSLFASVYHRHLMNCLRSLSSHDTPLVREMRVFLSSDKVYMYIYRWEFSLSYKKPTFFSLSLDYCYYLTGKGREGSLALKMLNENSIKR